MKRKRLKKLVMATGESRDNAELVSILWRGKARVQLAQEMRRHIAVAKRKAERE